MPSNPTTVLASSAGTAATVALDPFGAPFTVRITSRATDAGAGGRLEVTLNSLFGSTVPVVWSGLSSQGEATFLSTAALSSGSIVLASLIMDSQLIFRFTTPWTGIRLNCSAAASSGGIRMDVLQGR